MGPKFQIHGNAIRGIERWFFHGLIQSSAHMSWERSRSVAYDHSSTSMGDLLSTWFSTVIYHDEPPNQ